MVRLSYRSVALLVTALVALLSFASICVSVCDVALANSHTDATYAEGGTQ
jgi:hypothetical protein